MYPGNPYHARGQAQTRATAAYRAASETVTPARAIVMLYDGAIKRIADAKEAISVGRIEDRYNYVVKAYDIINGLHCHLDYEAGGEVAILLDRYYSYILHRLTEINVRNDTAICDEVIARLREMRDSWSGIAEAAPTSTVAATPPSGSATVSA